MIIYDIITDMLTGTKTIKNILFILLLSIVMIAVATAGLAYADSDALIPGDKPFADCDRIWFLNVSGGEFGSEMILVESDGRYGLIDSGNRYQDTIEDVDGTLYEAPRSSELSSQTPGRNGKDAMKYIIETLGVDHLDFIISTHSHSDHIGGIPEIAELNIVGKNGDTHSLIDESTVYFYKSYRHISPKEDDMADKDPDSWHNQAFSYQALRAVMAKGAALADVSFVSFGKAEDLADVINIALDGIAWQTGIEGLNYDAGTTGDPMDDKLSFSWGNMDFDLYNLYPAENALSENVNCIAAVITVDGHKIYTAGDLDVENQTEQRIAEAIALDHGEIDLVKVSHHGLNYSNSRTLVDLFRPETMIITTARSSTEEIGPSPSYRTMKYYAEKYFGTKFYEVGASDRILAADFEGGTLNVYEGVGEGPDAALINAEGCLDRGMPGDGWTGWYQNYNTICDAVWYYFVNGMPATGWQRIGGDWYLFDEEGLMLFNTWVEDEMGRAWLTWTGRLAINKWVFIDGDWYFFKENGYMAVNEWISDGTGKCYVGEDGRMLRSTWFEKDGKRVYIDSDGHIATNMWVWDEGGWMWMGSDGMIVKNKWIKSLDEWYYLKPNGYMAADEWAKDKTGWMWMNSNGKVVKNQWIRSKGEWYFLKASGYMAANEWAKDSSGWMWMDSDGRIVKNKWIQSKGEWYYLKASGYMAAAEWARDSSGWLWLDSTGKMVKNTWVQYKGDWYYLKADGHMATGRLVIGGKIYRFDSSGKWTG